MLHLPRTVTTPVTLLVSASSGEAEIAAELRYDPSDPLAVALVIGVGCAEPVVWIFARDLLQAGVTGPSGQGDITIEPTDEIAGQRTLRITLATDCLATMLISSDLVVEFLVETYALVPSGCELDGIDLDSEIAALLA